MEETLNLEDILEVIKKNLAMIIALVLLFGAAAAFATAFLMTPAYEANTQILVPQPLINIAIGMILLVTNGDSNKKVQNITTGANSND